MRWITRFSLLVDQWTALKNDGITNHGNTETIEDNFFSKTSSFTTSLCFAEEVSNIFQTVSNALSYDDVHWSKPRIIESIPRIPIKAVYNSKQIFPECVRTRGRYLQVSIRGKVFCWPLIKLFPKWPEWVHDRGVPVLLSEAVSENFYWKY